MKCRFRMFMMMILTAIAMSGCGQGGGGGAGLNGSISLTTSVTGLIVTATAIYTNPTQTNLVGLPITIKSDNVIIGTFNTNNSGTVIVTFPVPAFNGTQTITVSATTGNLSDFKTINMTGRSVSLTPPPTIAQASVAGLGASVDIPIPAGFPFVVLSDPFNTTGDLSGIKWNITFSLVKTDLTDSLLLTSAQTTTLLDGSAPFPGATATMHLPASLAAVNTMIVNWTVTEVTAAANKLTASGSTVIQLNYGLIPPLVFTPGSTSFSSAEGIGATHTLAISGGLPPYVATTVSSAPSSADAVVTGTNLIVTRRSATAFAGVTITVTDSVGSLGTVLVSGN